MSAFVSIVMVSDAPRVAVADPFTETFLDFSSVECTAPDEEIQPRRREVLARFKVVEQVRNGHLSRLDVEFDVVDEKPLPLACPSRGQRQELFGDVWGGIVRRVSHECRDADSPEQERERATDAVPELLVGIDPLAPVVGHLAEDLSPFILL